MPNKPVSSNPWLAILILAASLGYRVVGRNRGPGMQSDLNSNSSPAIAPYSPRFPDDFRPAEPSQADRPFVIQLRRDQSRPNGVFASLAQLNSSYRNFFIDVGVLVPILISVIDNSFFSLSH